MSCRKLWKNRAGAVAGALVLAVFVSGCGAQLAKLKLRSPVSRHRGEVERLQRENAELHGVAKRVVLETLEAQVRVLMKLQGLRRLRADEKAELRRAYMLARYIRGEIGLAKGEPLVVRDAAGDGTGTL